MLAKKIKEACTLLNIEALEDQSGANKLRVELDAFPLFIEFEEERQHIWVSAPLCQYSDAEASAMANLILIYNSQSFQTGGMRMSLSEDGTVEMTNDVVVGEWNAERTAQFLMVFTDISVHWALLLRQSGPSNAAANANKEPALSAEQIAIMQV
ncbi:type III secretion system chaperone [Polycladidibacter hongkongensis]|uniref:type III secretion system chaperone n=1 Tax=Polycladidibacter hongkongensis TaxID=1647556 RepID=UPI00082B142F|nr:type III secretion system chaperone [Pseudovibrio hongkongensis]